jgi:hypothetical protein
MPPPDFLATLEARRAGHLRQLGALSEEVVSRLSPLGGSVWPASALGRMRVVRRGAGRLLVTDGLSAPYDPGLHPNPPPGPLDFELALEVSERDPAAASDAALGASHHPPLLYALTDWLVPEWFDLRGGLTKFRALTLAAPPTTPEARALADDSGLVGFLVGQPLVGDDLDLHPYLNGCYLGGGTPYDHASVGYFPVKPLTPDEYAWAKAQGNEGGVLLAQKFLVRGDRHLTWTGRPSVLAQPTLD